MKKRGISSITHEELISSLDIQEWNLKSFARDIYENIGQILSLAKFQIASLNPEKKEEARQIAERSDQLLNKVIKDLRGLAKQLTPTEIMQKGFAPSLQYELGRLNRIGFCKTEYTTQGETFRLDETRELILFSIIQHYIIKALYIENAGVLKVLIVYQVNMINISILFPVNSDLNSSLKMENEPGISKRARLIGAAVQLNRKNGQRNIRIRIQR